MTEQNGEAKTPLPKGRGIGITGAGLTPGTSSSMSARLPSFRGPRDLTLSASSSSPAIKPSLITRTRKTFSPNIPVRREKNERVAESKSEKASRKNQDRDKKEGGRGRGRGRGKEFVQTTGSLFGEGIAAGPQRRAGGGYGSWGGGGGSGAGKAGDAGFINKPVLNLDTMNNIDKDHEDQKLKDLLRDNFIDDGDEYLGPDSDEDLFPVQLPMVDTGRGFKEEEGGQDIKNRKPEPVITPDGTKVKSEPSDLEEALTVPNEAEVAEDTKDFKQMDKKITLKGGLPAKEKAPEPSLTQLLTGKHKDVMFFQLPNSLPSHPPEIKQEPSGSQAQQQKHSQPQNPNVPPTDDDEEKKSQRQYCTLNTLPEGQIGTLKIYKSGKTELWLGDHKLIVNKGTQVGFLQDVVSVETDEEKKCGSMTVLGHVGHRLVCSPDLESLVRQKKT